MKMNEKNQIRDNKVDNERKRRKKEKKGERGKRRKGRKGRRREKKKKKKGRVMQMADWKNISFSLAHCSSELFKEKKKLISVGNSKRVDGLR